MQNWKLPPFQAFVLLGSQDDGRHNRLYFETTPDQMSCLAQSFALFVCFPHALTSLSLSLFLPDLNLLREDAYSKGGPAVGRALDRSTFVPGWGKGERLKRSMAHENTYVELTSHDSTPFDFSSITLEDLLLLHAPSPSRSAHRLR